MNQLSTHVDPSRLISVTEAMALIDAVPICTRTEALALDHAYGKTLAQALGADRDYPPFDKSLMDGYAVQSRDVLNPPVMLRQVAHVAAGERYVGVLGRGECVKIMTGAPMPAGADGVVPVEQTRASDGGLVEILKSDQPSRYVARQGADERAGAVVLPAGTTLGATQLAVAASVGASIVRVFADPTAAILSTGDEIVPYDQSPGENAIRNSNSIMLATLLHRLGCQVRDLGHVGDNVADIAEHIKRGFASDMLFITGGMSMGDHDYVPRVLAGLGMSFKITKLRIKPGKPFVFGVFDRSDGSACHIFGLPGNPVSGFVCTLRLAARLVRKYRGLDPEPAWVEGTLRVGLPPNGSREFYQPVRHDSGQIDPLGWKGSADVFTLARANALLIRAENEPGLSAGTRVRVLEIPL